MITVYDKHDDKILHEFCIALHKMMLPKLRLVDIVFKIGKLEKILGWVDVKMDG